MAIYYRIDGRKGNKPYRSRLYKSEKEALKAGYSMVYKKDGFNKRKNALHNWSIEKIMK